MSIHNAMLYLNLDHWVPLRNE